MRRPEVAGFISVAPPTNMYDFTFLAPCPASGIIIQGKIRVQKGIEISREIEQGAGHMFTNHMPQLEQRIEDYLDRRLPIVYNERRPKD